nr:hypothetical protein [Tanacetum cinerariifolium]
MPSVRSTSLDSTTPLSPDHPLTHTTPALVPILHRTACMVVRVLPAMSPGLSASIKEVAAMSDSVFRKRGEFDSDSESEDAKDEGPIAEDKDPDARDEDDEGHSVESDRCSSGEEEVVPKGQQRAVSVVGTAVGQGSGSAPEPERSERVSVSRQPTLAMWTDPEDDMVYIDVPGYPPPAPSAQTPPSPE